jgi:protein SCO1
LRIQKIKTAIICISLIFYGTFGATAAAQSVYADIASEMAKEGINQAEAKLNQLPDMLRDGIDIATAEREFESTEFCLGNVQALVNMGAVASNIMPFTKVWTYEDDRGPVGKLRVMLNGEKIHIEVYCNKTVLKSKTLPWGDGDKTLKEVNMSSVSALLGVGLNFQLQGIFDEIEVSQELESSSLGPQLGEKSCGINEVAGGQSLIGGPFELIDHNGVKVSEKDIINGLTLIYFGYTYCPDVCPMDTQRNLTTIDILDAKGIDVTPVFITIDPERDTVKTLNDYVETSHEKLIGLTGSLEQIQTASKAYKTFFRKNGDGEDYLIDHSTFSYLMDENGFLDFFRRDLEPEDVANTISCFAEKNY